MPESITHNRLLVALSGPLCAGKTTLAARLAGDDATSAISTRQILMSRPEAKNAVQSRIRLQDLGDHLDRTMGGIWLADAVCGLVTPGGPSSTVVVDAIRTLDQLNALRRAGRVAHVHLTAPHATRRARFAARAASTSFEPSNYEAVLRGSEVLVPGLRAGADLVLDTGELDVHATYISARQFLRTAHCSASTGR